MTKLILMTLVVFAGMAHAENLELRMACKAAAKNMGSGTGGTVYYPNGATLTTDAGVPGANWYHPNGATLTTDVSVPGANYYYANGATFSTDTGVAGSMNILELLASTFHARCDTFTIWSRVSFLSRRAEKVT